MKYTLELDFMVGDDVYITDGIGGYKKSKIKEIEVTKDGILYRCGSYGHCHFVSKTDNIIDISDGKDVIDRNEIVIHSMIKNNRRRFQHYVFVVKDKRLMVCETSKGIRDEDLGSNIREMCIAQVPESDKKRVASDSDRFWQSVNKNCIGMTLQEIREYYKENPQDLYVRRLMPTPKNTSLILSVKSPKFERYAGNDNKDTFDIIRVEVVLVSSIKKDEIQNNKDNIIREAIKKIESSKKFLKFGVPVNILKLYDFVVSVDGTVILSFCIKDK